ncbi:MAG: hypothetical protein SV760_04950, partial [Halobacteria archaeon]|nr:hypothetical protein [Halobacteria archaeon]
MDIKSKVLTVGVALLLFVSVVGVGAVVSGYVIVGDPGKAVSQVLSGNVTAPDVGVESVGVGKVNVPSVRVSDASIKEVTFEIEFFVN